MVEIIPYQETWPQEFLNIALSLRKALGNLALRIDHIGSTSVHGLAAKDVIDIQISVSVLDDLVVQALSAAGYQPREHINNDHIPPGFKGSLLEWQKMFFSPPAGHRRTNHTYTCSWNGQPALCTPFQGFPAFSSCDGTGLWRVKKTAGIAPG